MKKLIILLAFILPYSSYAQEKYLLMASCSQKEFAIQRCGYEQNFKRSSYKNLIRLRYDKEKNKLYCAWYNRVFPPYEGKSLFEGLEQEQAISQIELNNVRVTIEQILSYPQSAGKLFCTSLSYQSQWSDGISFSFIEPYELSGDGITDNIPTFSFKKKQ